MFRSTIVVSLLLALPTVAWGKVTQVSITPSFETAGVILTFDGDPSAETVTVSLQRAPGGAFGAIHPPVRFDARHMATSVFDLSPGTRYTLKVTCGGVSSTHTFKTRSEAKLPAAQRVVKVTDAASLRSALSSARAGDEIRLAAGTYSGGFTISASGTAAQPIVVTGQPSAAELQKPVQQRAGLPLLTGSSGHGVVVSGSYVVLQHLRVADNSGDGIRLDRADHAVVQGCQVYDNGSWANILITHGGNAAGNNLIQDNHIADLKHNTAFAHASSGDKSVTYYGIRNDDTPGPGTIIRRNRIEQHFDGITPCNDEEDTRKVSESATDIMASWPNHDVEVYDNVLLNQRDDGIEADGVCVNARIYRNRVETATNSLSISPTLPGPVFFVRNRLSGMKESGVKFNTASGRGTIRNIFFYHNTFVRSETGTHWSNAPLYLYDGTPSKDIVFRNNIFSSRYRCLLIQSNWTHKPSMDHDLWYSPQGAGSTCFVWAGGWSGGFADWQSRSGNESHGLWGDPKLDVNLRIAATSPATDRGQRLPGINDLYAGTAPDIGAVETGTPGPRLDGGATPAPDGSSPAGDGPGPSGDGPGRDSGLGVARPFAPETLLEGGCGGCGVPGAGGTSARGLVALLVGLALWRRRRRG